MSTFETISGRVIDILNPKPSDIDVFDIAHSLSRICRFGGHTRQHISVARHSLRVMTLVPNNLKLDALMHDAAEAYLGDVMSPLKQLLPNYQSLEEKWNRVIAFRFSIEYPFRREVHNADRETLFFEQNKLRQFQHIIDVADEDRRAFIKAYEELTGETVTYPAGFGSSPENIQREVGRFFSVLPEEMQAQTRKREIVMAREFSWYFIKNRNPEMTDRELGKMIGSRDTSTVASARAKIDNAIDPGIVRKREAIRKRLEAVL